MESGFVLSFFALIAELATVVLAIILFLVGRLMHIPFVKTLKWSFGVTIILMFLALLFPVSYLISTAVVWSWSSLRYILLAILLSMLHALIYIVARSNHEKERS